MHWITSIICLLIAGRLLAFQRKGATHKPWASGVAYVVIMICAAVPIFSAFGRFPQSGALTALFSFMILMAVTRSRGNIMAIIPSPPAAKGRVPAKQKARRKNGPHHHHS
ncbi:phage holin family protein [Serratia proteamaculans]|uniref:phage holin family protein n=1 Tax=Serratia proteamaculans TaxID=28151 RepID=UPI0039AEFA84